MRRGQRTFAISALVAMAVAQPPSLLACSVCYGAPDSGMAKGLVWGILALLSVVVSVLAGVVAFFVHVGKRSALAQGEKEAGSLLESTDKVS
jgi:hypothetical protein